MRRLLKECIWQLAEIHYERRRQPLGLLGVGNKVRREGLHSVLNTGPNQGVIKRKANAGMDSSANDHLALEAAFLQGVKVEKGLFMRTPRPLTTFTACMELAWL